jgi:hypothetical protein
MENSSDTIGNIDIDFAKGLGALNGESPYIP